MFALSRAPHTYLPENSRATALPSQKCRVHDSRPFIPRPSCLPSDCPSQLICFIVFKPKWKITGIKHVASQTRSFEGQWRRDIGLISSVSSFLSHSDGFVNPYLFRVSKIKCQYLMRNINKPNGHLTLSSQSTKLVFWINPRKVINGQPQMKINSIGRSRKEWNWMFCFVPEISRIPTNF